MKILVCPYCGTELLEEANYCCDEVGHGEWLEVCDGCEGEGMVDLRPCLVCVNGGSYEE